MLLGIVTRASGPRSSLRHVMYKPSFFQVMQYVLYNVSNTGAEGKMWCGVCTACVCGVGTRSAVVTRCTSDFDVEPGRQIIVPKVTSVSTCAIGFSRLVS